MQTFGGDRGAATAAGLALPRGLTMDAAGNLYFADSANHRIRRISPTGTITTVAGQGTETFAGDNAPAVSASLDSPRSVAISPAGLLTLADSDNQRVRQLDALPAPGPDIHTIAGLGAPRPSALSLSGSSVVVYGSGSVTATLTTSTLATGSVTFLDTSGGTQITLGTASLSRTRRPSAPATLAAGAHTWSQPTQATRPTAPRSPPRWRSRCRRSPDRHSQPCVNPLRPAIPALSGTLTGVLAQDAGKVAAVFTSTAVALSPAGSYPIAATLTGSAAGNYAVAVTPAANLSIAQAPTQTWLSASTSSPGLGLPVTLTVQASSTTSGVPTGFTLADGSTSLCCRSALSGAASFTTSSLALGAHNLSATYSGDANFLPSSSATAELAVGPASDFTMTATGATVAIDSVGQLGHLQLLRRDAGRGDVQPHRARRPGSANRLNLLDQPLLHPARRRGHQLHRDNTDSARRARISLASARPTVCKLGTQASLALLLLPMIGSRADASASSCSSPPHPASCWQRWPPAAAIASTRTTESINSTTYTLTVTGTATGPTGSALKHTAVVTLQVLQ